jgi:hypothetical protein
VRAAPNQEMAADWWVSPWGAGGEDGGGGQKHAEEGHAGSVADGGQGHRGEGSGGGGAVHQRG